MKRFSKKSSRIYQISYAILAFAGWATLIGVVGYDSVYLFTNLTYKVVTAFILLVILSNITSKLLVDIIKTYE